MKKLLIIMFSLGLALGASAQKVGRGPAIRYTRPQVVLGLGAYVPMNPYAFGYGYNYGFSPFYPYPSRFGYNHRSTKLDLKIEDIRNDCQDKIWFARHDKSISRTERKKAVHDLKHQRDLAITEAKRSYYKS